MQATATSESKDARVVSQKSLNRRKRKLEQMTPEQLRSLELSAQLQACIKELDLERALEVYKEGKASRVRPNKDAFNHVLALAAGLGEQGSGSFPVRTVEPPSDLDAAFMIFQDAKEEGVPVQEASYAGLIRCLALHGRHQEGLVLLREMQEKDLKMRLRSYSALLAAFCEHGDATTSMQLFAELSDKYSLEPTEREYVSMLSLCVLVDDEKFYHYLDSMLEDILVPGASTWEVVQRWFSSPRRQLTHRLLVDTITPTGLLQTFNHQLQSIELCESDRSQLIEQIDNCFQVTSNIAGAGASRPRQKAQAISDKWEQFKAWIRGDTEVGHCDAADSYSILIDGANVGFYQQNFANATGHVDYLQIDAMIKHCQRMHRKPLVVLHCRHLFADVLPPAMVSVVDSWKEQKLLYTTPAKCNDDLFWMYAAMIFNADVVTNDEMRDHHFKMLSPRWFMRWKERHQVRFKFGKFDHTEGRRMLETTLPPPYSHRIQTHNPHVAEGTESHGDEASRAASTHYFFPSVDRPEWLCVIPLSS